jgi:hypothetical protein
MGGLDSVALVVNYKKRLAYPVIGRPYQLIFKDSFLTNGNDSI